ncbi:MAG: efflux RND transporter periplasmic adaptor subunit [Phycisphaerae bacterium]|nr:efflux RND transporter periplasmic adaptor subunit [Phycisphaerae bacterium]
MRKYLSYVFRFLVVAAVVAFIFYRVSVAPVAVTMVSVTRGPIEAEVMGTGTLTAHTKATISPEIQGRLVELKADQNDEVAKGQLLACLDDSDLREQQAIAHANLEAAQATYARVQADQRRAEAVVAQAKLDYGRQSQLQAKQIASESELDKSRELLQVAEAEEARAIAAVVEAQKLVVAAERTLDYQNARLADTKILSPFDGLITRRDRDLGDVVVPGASIFQLISTKDIWVSAWVDETFRTVLQPGQKARIVFRSEPGKGYAGSVIRISREVDRETREFLVDVVPDRLPEGWAVGQRAEVFILTGRKDDVVKVPGRMIRWRENQAGIWVNEGGRASWRPLELGATGGEFTEVVRGLVEKDAVFVASEAQAKKLKPGRRVVNAR